MEEIPVRFKILRRERQLSQDEIARLLGVSRQTIFAIENGKSEPSLSLALRISSLFDEDITEVFSYLIEEELKNSIAKENEIAKITSNLIPFTPVNDINSLHQEIDRFFEDAITNPHENQPIAAMNIQDAGNHFDIEVAIPGFSDDDIDIEAGGDFLTIKGNKQVEENQDNNNYLKREFTTTSFERSIVLPGEIDSESIVANIEHGILVLKLPKIKPTQPKISKVKINKK